MAEYSPPTDNVPIFDVTNFAPSGSGLTEAQIASKFLRFPTGQGTETLSELITGTITAPNTMDIVMPNALASNVLNVGVVSRNISGQIHHYSDGDNCVAGAGVHINNGINNASATNIHNGTSSTGTVNIGSSGTSVGINGTTTITGTTNINTSSGLNTTIGTVTTGTTTLRGATIGLTNTNTVNINTNPPPDNTKAINIGGVNGANTTLTSVFGRLTTTGTTNINTSGTANTSIGVNGSTTAILGTTNINTSGTANTSIGVNGSTTAILGTTNINTSGTAATNIGVVGATTTIAGTTNINTSGSATTALGIQSSIINMRGGVNINTNGTGGYSGTTIGVAGSVTTINGTTNINTSGGSTTTIGTVNSGTSAINGATVNVGNADTVTTMNASKIKQVIKTVSADLIENIVGNTTAVSSMSTTFNRKYSSPVGGALSCFTIATATSNQFTNQYFEIYVCGANNGRGGYAFKGCFGLERLGGVPITATSVSTLFYNGTGISPPASTIIPVITFSIVGNVVTLLVNTSGGGSTDQSFIATLTAYPSCSIVGSISLDDYIITAV
jgi:hypothetical protein